MPFSVRFLPENSAALVEEPVDLFLAASRCDVWVEQPCGSKAICGKCRIRVVAGDVPVTAADLRLIPPADLEAGWRLACQVILAADAVIEVPPTTRSVAPKTFGPERLTDIAPEVVAATIVSPRPDVDSATPLLERVAASVGAAAGRRVSGVVAGLDILSELPTLAAAHDRLSIVVSHGEVLEARAARPGRPVLGVAVDLGSTSLAAALVDLHDGRVLATTSRLNPQVRFGPDIISRIHFAQEHRDGNRRLHDVLSAAIGEMITDLAGQQGVAPDTIYAVTCAGNATMTHSAAGADVTPLGEAPYVGLFTREWTMRAADLGLPVHPRAAVRLMPMIGRHVGGDTVAAALACEIDRADAWQLLVDLGTNAEVVVGCRDRILATSTAAGPAFEGANISCGMRAAPGAIDAVRVMSDGRVVVGTVANVPARGVCGSGLVDAVAELVRAGVIAPSGYLRSANECAARGVPAPLAARVVQTGTGGRGVQLANGVSLSARDVRELQLVKGSIAAGTMLLVAELGLQVGDLQAVHVAGTFGAYVRKTSALAIGLVPAIDPERVHFVGNAAGAGARLVLVDARARRRAIRLARRADYIELAGHPGYEDAFCRAIPFTEGEERHGS